MKKLLILLILLPTFCNSQTLQGYSGRYFRATQYFDAPIYKLNGVTKTFSQWTTSSSNIYFNSGNVGIGTTNPTYKLHLLGKSYLRGNTTFALGVQDADSVVNIFDALSGDVGDNVFKVNNVTKRILLAGNSYKVGINKLSPNYTLDVNGSINGTFLKSSTGIQVADDSDSATSANVGTIRYRTSGNNSYCEMCMQTGASTYAWVVIKTNSW